LPPCACRTTCSPPPLPPPLPQGDACALPEGLGTFNALLAANLLCRVPDPAACLDQMDAALAPGGLLVLTSPFTWLEEYTAKERWVGGRAGADGAPVRCADALKGALAARGYTVLDEGRVSAALGEEGWHGGDMACVGVVVIEGCVWCKVGGFVITWCLAGGTTSHQGQLLRICCPPIPAIL
jgi:hypothetical protein